MNNQELITIVGGCALFVVVTAVGAVVYKIVKLSSKKDRRSPVDVRADFTRHELEFIEAIMNKYRCTFDELALLGAWKFNDEGRNVFDIIDERRAEMSKAALSDKSAKFAKLDAMRPAKVDQ